VILNISDLLLGQSISENLNFLQNSQWWSRDKLDDYQNQKLQNLIGHAYDNVPYYRDLFSKLDLRPEDIQTKQDLHKLPILTKEIIKEHFPSNIVTKTIRKSKLYYSSSSGSTGEPLKFFNTKYSYSFRIASNLRGWYWMGYRLGDKFVKLSQNPRSKLNKKIQDYLTRNKYLFSKHLTEPKFTMILDEILKYKPKILRGYPDPLFFLAKSAEKKNLSFSISAINTTGNILFPEARNVIERTFNAKVFDSYSCEGAPLFFECPTHACYHGAMEYGISEIISCGKEVGPGECGRHIVTDLHNYAVPFIRFDTQDILMKSAVSCQCGRMLIQIDKIYGRDNDILVTPRGKYLIVHNFTGYFQRKDVIGVDQFQIYQEDIDKIVFNLVTNKNYSLQTETKIYNYWKNYVADDVEIQINVVDEILPTPSGKRRFLIRNKEIPLGL
jgi:phenylacetate-CoA ligase